MDFSAGQPRQRDIVSTPQNKSTGRDGSMREVEEMQLLSRFLLGSKEVYKQCTTAEDDENGDQVDSTQRTRCHPRRKDCMSHHKL